jgi:hypothetical protein
MKNDPDMEAFKAEAEAHESTGVESAAAEPGPRVKAAPTNPFFLEMGCKMIFRTIARYGGNHWLLSDEEAKQLGEAAGPVADKYLPAVLDKYGAEIMLAWSLTMIVIPRIGGGVGSEGQEAKNLHHHGAAGSGEVNAA